MKLRPEEITSILKQRIEDYCVETDLAEVGTVLQIGDGIARVYGLENAVAMEMLDPSTALPAWPSTSRTTSARRSSASGPASRRASRSAARAASPAFPSARR